MVHMCECHALSMRRAIRGDSFLADEKVSMTRQIEWNKSCTHFSRPCCRIVKHDMNTENIPPISASAKTVICLPFGLGARTRAMWVEIFSAARPSKTAIYESVPTTCRYFV